MFCFRNLLRFGVALALAAVGPAIVAGQSLTFLKTLPAAPPPWIATAAAGDASGIYIVEADKFLRKYDRDGAELWSRPLEGLNIRSMATSAAGVYVGGLTQTIAPDPQRSVTIETLIRLYDAQGNQLWTKQFGSTGNTFNQSSYVYAVAADASGVYVAGSFTTGTYLRKYDTRGAELWTKQSENTRAFAYPMVLAAGPSGIYFGQNDDKLVFLRKFDASGTEIWTRQVDGQYLTGVTANATGLYVTGFSSSGPFLSRYDSNGNRIWIHERIAGWIQRIAEDTDGIYAAGVTLGALTGQCAAGSADAFVKRFDADGNELWSRQFGTFGHEDVAGIIVDPSSIFVAGSRFMGDITYPAAPGANTFLAKLDKAAVAASPSETRIRNECVVNAASYEGGALTPGEIVTIFGTVIGPGQPVQARITVDHPLDTTLGETRILIGGVAAPLLYVSSGQSSAIVPNAVASQSSVGVQVEYRGVLSNAVTLPVLKARPGIFNLDASGWGAVRNEDGTLNSPQNPARRGSTVALFVTGGGELDPATADGQIVVSPLPKLKNPVEVSFPDTECTDYSVPPAEASSGTVAGTVAGLLQVSVRVPESLPPGNWSLQLEFGGRSPAETQSLHIAVR